MVVWSVAQSWDGLDHWFPATICHLSSGCESPSASHRHGGLVPNLLARAHGIFGEGPAAISTASAWLLIFILALAGCIYLIKSVLQASSVVLLLLFAPITLLPLSENHIFLFGYSELLISYSLIVAAGCIVLALGFEMWSFLIPAAFIGLVAFSARNTGMVYAFTLLMPIVFFIAFRWLNRRALLVTLILGVVIFCSVLTVRPTSGYLEFPGGRMLLSANYIERIDLNSCAADKDPLVKIHVYPSDPMYLKEDRLQYGFEVHDVQVSEQCSAQLTVPKHTSKALWIRFRTAETNEESKHLVHVVQEEYTISDVRVLALFDGSFVMDMFGYMLETPSWSDLTNLPEIWSAAFLKNQSFSVSLALLTIFFGAFARELLKPEGGAPRQAWLPMTVFGCCCIVMFVPATSTYALQHSFEGSDTLYTRSVWPVVGFGLFLAVYGVFVRANSER